MLAVGRARAERLSRALRPLLEWQEDAGPTTGTVARGCVAGSACVRGDASASAAASLLTWWELLSSSVFPVAWALVNRQPSGSARPTGPAEAARENEVGWTFFSISMHAAPRSSPVAGAESTPPRGGRVDAVAWLRRRHRSSREVYVGAVASTPGSGMRRTCTPKYRDGAPVAGVVWSLASPSYEDTRML